MKNVFITGSSKGIGREIALEFAKNGYRVIINASKDKKALSKTYREIKELNESCLYCFGDVSNYDFCKQLFESLKAQNFEIDILINNVGISYIGCFNEMNPSDWDNIIDINLKSAFNCTHLSLPHMINKKNGKIINISSIWGEVGASCEVVYSSTKGAINSFTKSLAKEVGPSNIKVNAIACGVIDTNMNNFLNNEEKQQLIENIALMRFGKTKEIAELALFLASDKSSYISGQIITIDGCML